jgi:hypothetical protein
MAVQDLRGEISNESGIHEEAYVLQAIAQFVAGSPPLRLVSSMPWNRNSLDSDHDEDSEHINSTSL